MSQRPVYLDYNATTPVDQAVAAAMSPYLYEHFGNPSSAHSYGLAARQAVDKARSQVANLIGAEEHEIVFTSGGSESNNMVFQGMMALQGSADGVGEGHVITSQIEHPAVLEPCRHCASHGMRITRLGVDGRGIVDPEAVAAAIDRYADANEQE